MARMGNDRKTGSDPSRETGVVVDIGLTLSEKGLTLFFFSFPSAATQSGRRRLEADSTQLFARNRHHLR
jgi:hypothetical protein